MAISLSGDQVRLLRMRAQRLTPQPPGTVAGVAPIVKDLCGIQAQDARAAMLGVRVRSADLLAAVVAYAREQERTILRTVGKWSTQHLRHTQLLLLTHPLLAPWFLTR